MPPASYWRPTMKPVMFCRNNRGSPAGCQLYEVAPFSALSEKRIPLLATTPTGYPKMERSRRQGFPVLGLELVEAAPIHDSGNDLPDVVLPPVIGGHYAV